MYFLGDIGGTKTIFALSLNLQKIDKKEFFLTPTTYKDFLHLVKNFKEKNKIKKIKKACLGIAGVLNNQKDKIIYSPNLKFLENQLLKKRLGKNFKHSGYFRKRCYFGWYRRKSIRSREEI
jgi:glucokinase